MKAAEIREMSHDERSKRIRDLRDEAFRLRFQKKIGQLENPSHISRIRREIARILTIERELLDKGSQE